MHVSFIFVRPHLLQYTKKGSGYNSTDEALRAVRGKSQCEWLSVTNCDNVYGSDVIARVFRSSHEYSLKAAGTMMRHGGSTRKPLDMIIVPVDSRSFKGKFSGNGQTYIKHLITNTSSCNYDHPTSSTSSPS